MPTIFSRIISGELPSHLVHEDDVAVVFLSINPISRGHALVVPRREVDSWLDLRPGEAHHLMDLARLVGEAQRSALSCARVGLVVAGFEVPHCHVHVIPANSMSDLDFARAATNVDHDDLARTTALLSSAMPPLPT